MAAVTAWPTTAADGRRLVAALADPRLTPALEQVAEERALTWTCVASERAVLTAVADDAADLVVLGLGNTGLDAFRLLEAIRERSTVPVIVLTHRDAEGDRVLAYELGVDDFVAVPCSTRELAARVDAVLRRASPVPATTTEFGSLRIDRSARRVTVASRPVDLTRREFDLLACLARKPRRTFTRDELLREVWGSSAAWQSPATVTEHVRRLRRKLGPPTPGLPRLATVHGVGYRFDP